MQPAAFASACIIPAASLVQQVHRMRRWHVHSAINHALCAFRLTETLCWPVHAGYGAAVRQPALCVPTHRGLLSVCCFVCLRMQVTGSRAAASTMYANSSRAVVCMCVAFALAHAGYGAAMRQPALCVQCVLGWFSPGGPVGSAACRRCQDGTTSNPTRTACGEWVVFNSYA